MNREEALDIVTEGRDLISEFRKEFEVTRYGLEEYLREVLGLETEKIQKYKVLFRYYRDKFQREIYGNAEGLGVADNWYSDNSSGANIVTALNTLEKKMEALTLVANEIVAVSTDLDNMNLDREDYGGDPIDYDQEMERLEPELEIEADAVMNWLDILYDDLADFSETL